MTRYQNTSELATSRPGIGVRPLLPEPHYWEKSRPLLSLVTAALMDIMANSTAAISDLTLCMSDETALRVTKTKEIFELTGGVWAHEGKYNHAIDIAGRMLYGLHVMPMDLAYGVIAVANSTGILWRVEDVFS